MRGEPLRDTATKYLDLVGLAFRATAARISSPAA